MSTNADTTPRTPDSAPRTEGLEGANRRAEYWKAEHLAANAEIDRLTAERDALRESIQSGEASDGYHTHRELYEYRMLYNAHAAHGWLAAGLPVVKSWKHSDGEPCFGGGWFIVVAQLPTGQVSNHYREEHWSLFDVPAVEMPPEYDGHSPADAADRLRRALNPEGADHAD